MSADFSSVPFMLVARTPTAHADPLLLLTPPPTHTHTPTHSPFSYGDMLLFLRVRGTARERSERYEELTTAYFNLEKGTVATVCVCFMFVYIISEVLTKYHFCILLMKRVLRPDQSDWRP